MRFQLPLSNRTPLYALEAHAKNMIGHTRSYRGGYIPLTRLFRGLIVKPVDILIVRHVGMALYRVPCSIM